MKIVCKSIKSITSKGTIFLGDTSSEITLDIEGLENETEIFNELLENGLGCEAEQKLQKEINKLNIQIYTLLKYREEPWNECVRLQNANCKLDGDAKRLEITVAQYEINHDSRYHDGVLDGETKQRGILGPEIDRLKESLEEIVSCNIPGNGEYVFDIAKEALDYTNEEKQ